MRKRTLACLTLGLVLFAVAMPIGVALWQARRQGLKAEFARALQQADEILRRSEESSAQIRRGFAELGDASFEGPCTPRALDAMRRVDVGSSMIQAVGYVEDAVLKCSSLGVHVPGIPLPGGPDVATGDDLRIRANVELPFLSDRRFIAAQQGHYVAILHKGLVLDPSAVADGMKVGTFWEGDEGPLPTRGTFDTTWLTRTRGQAKATFIDGPYAVAVIRSQRYRTGAVAAVPMADVDGHVRALSMILLPIGAAVGLLLAWAVRRLAKWQSSMPSMLRGALRRDEFFLVYEPLVDVRTGRWIGAEALIRWRRANGELVRPDLFIPVAEESGLIGQITERVLSLAERDTAALFERHPDFTIAVNLSAADLHDAASIARVRELAARHRQRKNRFIVEISERGVLQTDLAQQAIGQFREAGVSVAIDDFGTGYSCLSYLASLKLDILKIDKAFVDSLGTQAPTSRVAQYIIAMAQALDLTVIAEGVETLQQFEILRSQRVQLAQGYLFSRPLRMADLLERIGESEARHRRLESSAA